MGRPQWIDRIRHSRPAEVVLAVVWPTRFAEPPVTRPGPSGRVVLVWAVGLGPEGVTVVAHAPGTLVEYSS